MKANHLVAGMAMARGTANSIPRVQFSSFNSLFDNYCFPTRPGGKYRRRPWYCNARAAMPWHGFLGCFFVCCGLRLPLSVFHHHHGPITVARPYIPVKPDRPDMAIHSELFLFSRWKLLAVLSAFQEHFVLFPEPRFTISTTEK